MATRIRDFDKVLPLILALPVGTYFDCWESSIDGLELQMQAPTQRDKANIQQALGVFSWEESYEEKLNWWRYNAVTADGIKLEIYAVREAPAEQEVPA
jgi:hypothetical protein